MNRLKNIDLLLTFAMMSLTVLGVIFIYSSSFSNEESVGNREWLRQLIWSLSGFALFFSVLFFNFQLILDWAVSIYVFSIILLLATMFMGTVRNNAQSWLTLTAGFGFQPSEFSKLALILLLCKIFAGNRSAAQKNIEPFKLFLATGFITVIPALLVTLQPDIGTASVYIVIYITMMFFSDITLRYTFFVIAVGVLTILLVLTACMNIYIWQSQNLLIISDGFYLLLLIASLTVVIIVSLLGYLFFRKKYFYWLAYAITICVVSLFLNFVIVNKLENYQIRRLITFIEPALDPLDSGWNVNMSFNAIGSGGLTGKGFLQGTHSRYNYLPQHSTDFIFAIIAEQFGFVGSVIVFALFLLLFWRLLYGMKNNTGRCSALFNAGVFGALLYHFLVNIGMAMGIMPVTGIPLPFISYGGSFLWVSMLMTAFTNNFHASGNQ